MDASVLIHSIVRQTTVLVAHLATYTGGRAVLAQTANEVFLSLVQELRAQGLGQKVIADMFGLALRTYHGKVRRLSESSTVRGRSLWDATLEYVGARETVLQTDVLHHFRNDDEASVRGVLADLVESGLVFKTGRGARTTYRAARPDEYAAADPVEDEERMAHLVWVAVNRLGPATAERLGEAVPLDRAELDSALERLTGDGRIERVDRHGTIEYRTALCFIPFGSAVGWEAAVFDHYQAMVTAICTKLRRGTTSAAPSDRVGGSTYALTIWDGHPHYEEVLSTLSTMRTHLNALRERVTTFNATQAIPEETAFRVVSYVGQTVLGPESAERNDHA